MSKRRAFGSVEKRKGRPGFYVKFSWNGRRHRLVAGRTRRLAEQKLSAVHVLAEKGCTLPEILREVFGIVTGPRITFQEAGDLYLEYSKKKNRTSTYERDVIRMRRVCRAPWSSKGLAEIEPDEIEAWLGSMLEAGRSPSTANRYRSLVSSTFRWAVKKRHVAENPVKNVERFSEAGRGREAYLSAEEAQALVSAAETVFRPLVVAALHTGARRAELLGLRWKDIDFARGELVVEAAYAKSGKLRVIPMTPALAEELRALREARKILRPDGTDPVFTYRDGSPIKKMAVAGMMARAVRRCDEIPVEKKKDVTFHVTRHTFSSLAAQNGVTLFELQSLLGHSTPAMTARYAHFFPEGPRAAVNKLGRVLSGRGPKARSKRSGA